MFPRKKYSYRRALAGLLATIMFAQQVQLVTLAEEIRDLGTGTESSVGSTDNDVIAEIHEDSGSEAPEAGSGEKASGNEKAAEKESVVEIGDDDASDGASGSGEAIAGGSGDGAGTEAGSQEGGELSEGASEEDEEDAGDGEEAGQETGEPASGEGGSSYNNGESSEGTEVTSDGSDEGEIGDKDDEEDPEAGETPGEAVEPGEAVVPGSEEGGSEEGGETGEVVESGDSGEIGEPGESGENGSDETDAPEKPGENEEPGEPAETPADVEPGSEEGGEEETSSVIEIIDEDETEAPAPEDPQAEEGQGGSEEDETKAPAGEETGEPTGEQTEAPAEDQTEAPAPEETQPEDAGPSGGGSGGGGAGTVVETVPETIPETTAAVTVPEKKTITITFKYGVMTDGERNDEGGEVSRSQEKIRIKADDEKEGEDEDEDDEVPEILGSIATAKDGYVFTGWTLKFIDEDLEDEEENKIYYEYVSEDEELIPEVDMDETATYEFFANFEKEEEPIEIEPITITLRYSVRTDGEAGEEGGTISLEEEVIELPGLEAEDYEEAVEEAGIRGAIAEANEGYLFKGWSLKGGELITEDEELIPEVDMDATAVYEYVADFEKEEVETPMPEQFFTDYANGVRINVTAPEGAFPEGTKMKVKAVYDEDKLDRIAEGMDLAENEEVKSVRAVDISFYYNDEEIEPQIPIFVELKTNKITDESKIIHLDDGGDVTDMGAEVDTAARVNNATFESDLFSIYAIVETGEREVDTIVKVNYTVSPANSGTVSPASEEVTVPADSANVYGTGSTATANDGYVFVNWTDADGNVMGTEPHLADPNLIPIVTGTSGDTTFTANFKAASEIRFRNRDGEVIETVYVEPDTAIGTLPETIARDGYDAYWATGEEQAGGQSTVWVPIQRIDQDFVPEEDTDIIPDYDKTVYTVKFYADEEKAAAGTPVLATKTVDVDTSYCLNDIPAVPEQEGAVGKWVYAEGNFDNNVAVNKAADSDRVLSVWAEYEKNVFTVKFLTGEEQEGETYQTDTYFLNDTLVLPTAPVVEGKEFQGWYDGDTQYVGGEAVTKDLTLTARFTDMYFVRFVIKNDQGEVTEQLSQYFRTGGQTIGTMPQDPFVSGKIFEKWVNETTEEEVTAETVVNSSITAVAVFSTIDIYTIETQYYYLNKNGGEVQFNVDVIQVEGHALPYTITAPGTTQTDPTEVTGGPIYYPSTPTVQVTSADFPEGTKQCTVRIQYVPYTAEYNFVYLLKNLDGNGYTEIERVSNVQGVLNSYVTPTVKQYDYAVLEMAEGATITQAQGQNLNVYYNRKHFQLTYESNGGSYVGGVTVPYQTQQAVTSTVPTRTGYTFDGWYLDSALTQRAGNRVTVDQDKTLYAKWRGNTVDYTIVYLFEKYDDNGTTASFVYDNSRTGSGTVGSTVQASSAPEITRTGWEKDTARNNNSSVVIEADGSSVLYVYYKLTEYTFYFRPGSISYVVVIVPVSHDITATLNGDTKTGNNNFNYTMKVKLGQDISSMWPSLTTGEYRPYIGSPTTVYFKGWKKTTGGAVYVTKRLTVTEEMLPTSGNSITYEGEWLYSSNTYTVNYLLQNADDDGYTRSEKYSQTYQSDTSSLDPKDISGYTFVRRNDSGNTFNFYYDRDKYKIDYYYGSNLLNTINNVKFDANINKSPYIWTPTQAQCGVDSDYTWGGWYSDAGLSTAYTFDKMPAANLALYAKWSAPSYTVSFVDGDAPATQVAESQTVEKYKRASIPETNPTKAGYVFDGWYSTADGDDLFEWTTQITKNTTVYAHWSPKILTYTVHYVDEDGVSVADDKFESNPNLRVGQVVTEQAIAVAGYRPDANSKQVTLTEDDSQNVITFVYSAKALETSYTVRYLLDPEVYPDNIAVAAEKTETVQGDTASVIEMAAPVDYESLIAAHPEYEDMEFFPDAAEKTLVLTANAENNVFTFYYSSFKKASVKVHFVDMDGHSIANDDIQNLKMGKNFTLSRTPIAGWELDKAVEGTSYEGTTAGDEYKITRAVTESGLEFTIFYRKKATITAQSFTQLYNGNALKMPAALADQVKVEGLKAGDSLTSVSFNYANTDNDTNDGRINAGVATVTPKDAVISGHTHPDYYSIRYISGTLEVSKINVTVRVEPDRWVGARYTGEEYRAGFSNDDKQTIEDYVLISNAQYRDAYKNQIWNAIIALDNVKSDPTLPGMQYYVEARTDAGDYTYNIGLTPAMLPQDPNYSVSLFVRSGRLQILPVNISVTTGSATKPYDGTPLTKDEASISGLMAADESKVTITATGSRTKVGSSPNTYTIDWGEAKSGNYRIATEDLGTLIVTESILRVTVKDATKTYNGAAQNGYSAPAETVTGIGSEIDTDEYTITGLFEGHKLTVSSYTAATGTNVGTYTNGAFGENAVTVTDADGNDVTSSYDIAVTAGKLTIEKAPLTITADSASKPYDGTALTDDGWQDTPPAGLQGTDTVESVTVTGTITEVGTEDNVPSAAVVKNGDADVTSNYEIQYVNGTLEITSAEMTVEAVDYSGKYDGAAHDGGATPSVTGATIQYRVKDGETWGEWGDTIPSITNVGTVEYEVKASAPNYSDATDTGTLTVTKRSVTLTSETASKPYDGTALTRPTVTVTGDGFVDGEVSNITATGSVTTVAEGEVTNTITYTAGAAFNADNYDISKSEGTLKITPATMTVTAVDYSGTYDGAAHDGGATPSVTQGTTVQYRVKDGETWGEWSSSIPSITNVDTVEYEVKAENPNYTTVTDDGTLTVTKKNVTFTSESDTRTYTGSEIELTTVTADGLISGHTHNVTYSAKGTEVGEHPGTITAVADVIITDANDNDVTANYNITTAAGTLTITKTDETFTISLENDEYTYDGTDHYNTKTATSTALSGTTTFLYSFSESGEYVSDLSSLKQKNAGTYTIYVRGSNPNYNAPATTTATLKINKKAISFTGETATKTYTGSEIELTTVTADGLISGHTHNVTYSAKGTEVGEHPGTITAAGSVIIKDADDVNVTENYTITTTAGKLIIEQTDEEFTISLADDTYVYDGGAHYNAKTATSTAKSGTTDFTYSFTEVGYFTEDITELTQVDAGEYTIYVQGTNTNYTGIAKTTAKLTINKRPVTFTGKSESHEYTGSTITINTVDVSSGEDQGLVNGHTHNVEFSASGIEAGDHTGTITAKADVEIKSGDTVVTDNYDITVANGTLTITKTDEEFEISLADDSYVYNDMEYYNKNTATSTAASGTTTYSYSFTKSSGYVSSLSELKKKDAGEYTIYVKATNPNYENEATTTAKLTISKRPVTFTGKSETKTYTGSTITINTVEISGGEDQGLVSSHTHNVVFSASGIEAGEYTGTITAKADVEIKDGEIILNDNYDITVVNGKLTIEKTDTEFSISLADDSYVYDGGEHNNRNTATSTAASGTTTYSYSFTEDSGYVSDLTSLKKTDAGNYTIYVKATNPNYKNTATTTAKLTINKRPVTFTGKSETKTYTGSTITINTVEVSSGENAGLVSGHTHNVAFSASGIEANTYTGTITAKENAVIQSGGTDVTANYDITVVNGTLTIEKTTAAFTVSLANDSYVYDGKDHANAKTPTSTASTGTTSYSYSFEQNGTYVDDLTSLKKKDVGEYTIYVKATNPNYANGAETTAQLVITVREISVAVQDLTLPYNGTEQSGNTAYSFANLAEGHTGTITYTAASGTEAATYDNGAYTESSLEILDGEGNNVTANYDLTQLTKGKLTISPLDTLAITLENDSFVYDGGEHYNTNTATSTAASGTTSFSYSFEENGTYVPDLTSLTKTDVGIYTIYVKAANPNYSNEATTTATLTITRRPVTFTGKSETHEYTGSTITINTVEVSSGENEGLVSGHTHNVEFSASGIDANTYTGTITAKEGVVIKNGRTDVTANYDITVVNGTLTIEKTAEAFTVSLEDDTYEYDGSEHSNAKTATSTAKSGTTTIEYSKDGTNWTTDLSSLKAMKVAESFTIQVRATNPNYTEGATTTAKLTITKAPLTITADSAEKEYDGTPLTDDGWQDTAPTGLKGTDTIQSVTVEGTITYSGTEPNVASGAVIVNGTDDRTANYDITYAEGTLEIKINTKWLHVRSADGSWTYDGNAHTKHEYTVKYGDDEIYTVTIAAGETTGTATLSTGDTVTITPAAAAAVTHVAEGKVINKYDFTITNQGQYQMYGGSEGSLKVTPAKLTITTETARRQYNGHPLTASGSISGFVTPDGGEQETATFTVTGTITTVGGPIENSYSLVWDGTAAESDYTLDENLGTLTIIPSTKDLVIESSTKTWTYDGKTHTDEVYTVKLDLMPASVDASGKVFTLSTGDTVTITPTAAGVKDYDESYFANNTYTYVLSNADCYEFVSANKGTLSIDKRTVTLTSEGGEKPYDGTPLTKQAVTVSGDGFVEGEVSDIKATGSVTTVAEGPKPNTIVYTEGQNFKADNYNITKNEGTLQITASTEELKVVSAGGEWTYDGNAHTNKTYTVIFGSEKIEGTEGQLEFTLSTGDKVTVSPAAAATITHAGEIDNAFSYTVENSGSYSNQAKEEGKLKVTPATLTVTTGSASKEYDGQPLTAEGSISGFVTPTGGSQETATFTVTGSQTEVGGSENTYTLAFDKTAAESDYTVSESLGRLEVLPNTTLLKVVSADGEWTYDGNAHTNKTYTVSFGNETIEGTEGQVEFTLGTGDKVTVTPAAEAAITHVAEGNVTNAFSYTVENSSFYGNQTKEEGNLTVTPATLTVTTQGGEKEYDGKPLTAEGSISGFVTPTGGAQETATFTVTGSRTEVGESQNTYTLVFDKTAVESDYTVSEDLGTLKITKSTKELKITSGSVNFTYDGNAHAYHKYTVVYGNESYTVSVAEGEATAVVTLSTGDSITITPDAEATLTHVLRKDTGGVIGKDNAFSYTLEHSDQYNEPFVQAGRIVVEPATLTVTTQGGEKEYDGKPLTAEGSISGFVTPDGREQETATFTVTGSQTLVGESENTYTLEFDGTAVDSDYTVSKNLGTLKVTKNTKEVKVVSISHNFDYDGNPHTWHEYAVIYNEVERHNIVVAEGETTGSATLSTGDKVTITPDPAATVTHVMLSDEGSGLVAIDNSFDYVLEHSDQYANVGADFGRIGIRPKELTVTTDTASKEYDGKPLTAAGSISGFVTPDGREQETATFTVTGTITKVGGPIENSFELVWDGTALKNDYWVNDNLGTLEVTPNTKALVIESSTKSWTYDTQVHKDETYKVTFGDDVIEGTEGQLEFTLSTGDTVTITPTAEGVRDYNDSYSENNTYEYVLTNADCFSNVTAKVGTLSIEKAPLTITADSAEKEYDGKVLEDAGWQDTAPVGLKGTDKIESVNVEGTITLVGKADNVARAAIVLAETADGSAIDVTDNYEITYVKGVLEISPSTKPLVITSSTKSWTYDGQEHKDDVFTVTYDGTPCPMDGGLFKLPTKDTVSITPMAAGVKDYDRYSENNEFSYYISYSDGFDNVTTNVGTLSIEKRVVELTSEGGEKEYDGTPLIKPGVTVAGDGFVQGEVDIIEAYGIVITVEQGEVANTILFTTHEGFKEDNYDITKNEGKLKITPSTKALVISSSTKAWEYDGETHKDETYTVTFGNDVLEGIEGQLEFTLSTGDTLTITPTAEGVRNYSDEYSENNTFTYKLENAGSYGNVTAAYGTLSITRKAAEVTADNSAKTFGDPDPEEFAYTVTGTVAGEEGLITATVTRPGAGTDEDAGFYKGALIAGGEAIQGNYTVTYNPGDFTIAQAGTMTVVATPYEGVYDGQEHVLPEAVSNIADAVIEYAIADPDGDIPDEQLNWTDGRPAGTDVTDLTVKVRATHKNYETVITETAFRITARPVTVTAEDKNKVFGQEDPELTVNIDGALPGDRIEYQLGRTAGEDVGEYAITPAGAESQHNGDYLVTYVPGKLTIKPAEVTVTAEPKTKVYGDPDPVLTAVVTGLENVPADNTTANGAAAFEPEYKLSRADGEDVGTYVITPAGEEIQGNYHVTYVTDNLTITKAKATVTAEDKTKVYGEADPALTAKVDGLKNGDAADVIRYELTRAAGENAGEYVITAAGDAAQGNYDVEYVNGKLTITPYAQEVVVKITGEKKSVVYDGKQQSATGYTVESISAGQYKEADFSFNGEAAVRATDVKAGTDKVYAMGLAAAQFTNNNQNFTNVTFDVTDGGLEITPAPVTVKAEDKTKAQGAADPELTATVTGLIGDDTVTYTITRAPGETVGTYVITPAGDAEQGNYTVTYVTGNLLITIRGTILIVAEDHEKIYDGEAVTEAELEALIKVTMPSGVSKDDYVFEYTYAGGETLLNVGEYTILTGVVIKDKQGNVVAEYGSTDTAKASTAAVMLKNAAGLLAGAVGIAPMEAYAEETSGFELSVTPGTYTIRQREVTVKADNAEKRIGLRDPAFTATLSNVVKGEEDLIKYTIARKGTSDRIGTLAGEIVVTGDRNQGNYVVNFEAGDLTVTRRSSGGGSDDPSGDDPTPSPNPYENEFGPGPAPETGVLGAVRDAVSSFLGGEDQGVLGAERGVLGAARTGDESGLLLHTLLMMLSAASMSGMAIFRRKREDEE